VFRARLDRKEEQAEVSKNGHAKRGEMRDVVNTNG
jgi:hypothetical protein